MHIKFHKDWFSHSKIQDGIDTDSKAVLQAYFYFFKIREVGLKTLEGSVRFDVLTTARSVLIV
jgi:hypothetical protein